jgi:hypothetical protein
MLEAINLAAQVRNWANYLKLPKELQRQLDLFDAVESIRPYRPDFDYEGLTPQNAPERIRELAVETALMTAPAAGGVSPIGQAKNAVLGSISSRLILAAREAAPDLAGQLRKQFGMSAEAYTEAVRALPHEITAESLLNAGPEAAVAFQRARNAMGYLSQAETWLVQVAGVFGMRADNTIRIIRPATLGELGLLDRVLAENVNSTNRALRDLNPVYLAAARAGIGFDIVLPREAADLRRALSLRVAVAR